MDSDMERVLIYLAELHAKTYAGAEERRRYALLSAATAIWSSLAPDLPQDKALQIAGDCAEELLTEIEKREKAHFHPKIRSQISASISLSVIME